MEEMFHRLVRGHTQVVKLLEPGFRYVKADPTQIEQVVINLVINAIEAMPDGGRLTIETEYVAVSEDQCSAPDEHAGAYVCLSVTDTGIGMDEETMQRLGEPFFSTKKTGTGLGLSTAYTIISQYDGWTRVQSKPGKGSAFRVFLPACADLDYEAAEIKVLTEFHGKGEKILLVEDDACVRATITEMLRAGGYHVVEVEDAEAALNVFEGENGNFQLVFSDVVLPKKDGLQLVDELLEHKPELSVILSSGYADQRSRWPIIRDRGYHFLPKPYGLPELLPVVKEALSSRKSLSTAAPY
jgi:CheY-like chemotaxis protein